MHLLRLSLAFLFAITSVSSAQIFADFTVSTGSGEDKTPLGTFRAELAHEKAPRPVANFIGLATGQRPWIDIRSGKISTEPYYEGQIFHRLVHNFVIQGGDILGTGRGGPGYVFQDQFEGDLRHSGRYFLSMAKSSLPNSNGSQFFITLTATPFLNDKHSVFGEVISGREIIDGFTNAEAFPTEASEQNDPELSDAPLTPINLDSVVISGPDAADFDLFNPAWKLPSIEALTVGSATYDPSSESFTVNFPREASSVYRIENSLSLSSLALGENLLSASEDPGYALEILQTAEPQHFARLTRADYSLLPNAPADLVAVGHEISFTDRNGDSVSLTFTSETGGSWSDASGASGAFAINFEATGDQAPDSGVVRYPPDPQTDLIPDPGQLFPLYRLDVTFDTPAGTDNWRRLQVYLSFHEEDSGWFEGLALVPQGDAFRTINAVRAFTWSD
jgi:peptidyl-prolyl cis-trans isomerase A (cyclophilin A)